MALSQKARIQSNYLFICFAIGCTSPFLPLFYKEFFHLSDREVGLALMIRPVIALLSQPFWSLITDMSGLRARICGGLVIAAGLCFPLLPTAGSLLALFLFIGVWAFFNSPINSLSDAVAFDYLGHHRRLRFGDLRVYASLGFLIAVSFIGRVFDRTGIQLMFPLYAVLMAGAAFFMFKIPSSEKTAFSAGLLSLRALFKKRNVVLFLSAILLGESGNQMGYAFLSLYGKSLGASNLHIGWIWGLATLSEVVTMLFFPKIVGRWGIKKVLVAGTLSGVLRWTGFILAHHWIALLPLQALHAFTYTFIYVGSAIFMDMEGHSRIRFTSQAFFSTIVINAACIFGSFAGGEISQAWNYRTLFLASASLCLISSLMLVLFVHRPDHGS